MGPRVLVTDGEHRSVLAACRGLAAGGYRVATVSDERFPAANWSRFADGRSVLGPRSDPAGYVERLARLIRAGGYEVVIPSTDPALIAISQSREHIEAYVRLGLPPHKTVLESLDKLLLHRRADEAGLAPPRGIVCSGGRELSGEAHELGFPLIIKPAASWVRVDGYLRERGPRVLEDAASLAGAEDDLPLTLQEYLPHAAIVSCAGVRVPEGEVLGFTVARYERAHPRPAAKAAFAVTIPPPPGLRERVTALLAAIGWTGIFELELLELDDRLAAIDFNPRPFGWMSLAIGAGANLPAIWCDYLLGRGGAETGDARVGRYFRREDAELVAAARLLLDGGVREAAAVLRPHRRVIHAYFRLDDPAPAVARLLSAMYYRRRVSAHGDRRRRPRQAAQTVRSDRIRSSVASAGPGV
jgi:predicted ATP-grasp superfamily ATP-dependent carboligase